MLNTDTIEVSQELLALLAEIDEFKGAWRLLGTIAPERLNALRRVATIESIGSSTRIEGSKLTDREVERLLSNLEIRRFDSRDEQEVAGYADVMETIFRAWSEIPVSENHIKQLHRDLLQYSDKDERHRGEYKALRNDVGAFDAEGKMLGIVFETATPFDTPQQMAELVAWLNQARELRRLHPLLALQKFDAETIHQIWLRAMDRRETDPEGAITLARTLLETVCKHILDEHKVPYESDSDLPGLYKMAAKSLNIAPSQHSEPVFKQILGGCTAVVEGLGALRNRLSDAHGQGKRPVKPASRHAELAVNLCGAVAMFLVATHQALPTKEKN
jgi:hypothetical protein